MHEDGIVAAATKFNFTYRAQKGKGLGLGLIETIFP